MKRKVINLVWYPDTSESYESVTLSVFTAWISSNPNVLNLVWSPDIFKGCEWIQSLVFRAVCHYNMYLVIITKSALTREYKFAWLYISALPDLLFAGGWNDDIPFPPIPTAEQYKRPTLIVSDSIGIEKLIVWMCCRCVALLASLYYYRGQSATWLAVFSRQ